MQTEQVPGTEVTVERDLAAVMRDGTILRSDVYRPTFAGEFPILLIRGPYDKRVGLSSFGNAHAAWYAKHGYIVVLQDCRGRYSSGGDFYPFLHEMNDGYDTVEWAAKIPGSNGQVGMFGFSYLGATQLLAAVMRPPSLKSIVPAFTASQYYDGWTYNGGALALAFVCYWANLLAVDTAARLQDIEAVNGLQASLGTLAPWFYYLPLAEYPVLKGPYAEYFYDWIEHNTYDEYWKRWSIDEDYGRIDVPGLHIGGWYDVFLTGTVKNFLGVKSQGGSEDTRRKQKLLIGPWTHMPWTPVGPSNLGGPSTNQIDDWQLQWFDYTLKGIQNGALDHAVTVFTVDGSWRNFDSWPPKGVECEDWYFHSAGRANSKFGDGTLNKTSPTDHPPDIFVSDPNIPVPSQGGHSCCFDALTPMGPADQLASEVSRMALIYTSEPLTEEIELLGNVAVVLYVASTAPDTDFTARLSVVSPLGRSVNLQEGIIRARYRESLTHTKLLEPGVVYELVIELGPIGASIAVGSRLRVAISSSDFPQWDRNLNSGGPLQQENILAARPAMQTVFHDTAHPSRIILPILRI